VIESGSSETSAEATAALMGREGRAQRRGVLRAHASNPRYFTDDTGDPIYLTGSNFGWELQDDAWDVATIFDYEAYLDLLARHGHNFLRLWVTEHTRSRPPLGPPDVFATPMQFERTDGRYGLALDGRPKFDLDRFNQPYFDRLRDRVECAGSRGINVAVMLFQGFSVRTSEEEPFRNGWFGHPFNIDNNVNGVDGDPDGDGEGEVQLITIGEEILERQREYTRKVVDTVHDLDNVLYELCNEQAGLAVSGPQPQEAVEWAYEMVRVIKAHEATKPKQHPVGVSGYGTDNAWLLAPENPADWIAPGHGPGRVHYFDPPAATGTKVIIADTDHIHSAGVTDHLRWVWRSFLRGLNTSLLDWGLKPTGTTLISPEEWDAIRRAMGDTRDFSRRLELATALPRGDLTSTGYCLATPGLEYLVYQQEPAVGPFTVDLSHVEEGGALLVDWFDPSTSQAFPQPPVGRGAPRMTFTPPWGVGQSVLYVRTSSRENSH
jgi:hypothetical protein